MSLAPLVVAGVAVYNGMRFLQRTLETIVAQDYPNLRIVIRDDASTDGSLELCRRFERQHSRVTVVSNAHRLGWIGNYNALLEDAEGDFFVWMAHDDLYEPDFASALARRLESSPGAVVAYSGGELIEADGRPAGTVPTSDRYGADASRFSRGMRFVWWTEVAKGRPFRGVMRTAALRRTKGLRKIRYAADSLLMFELALAGGIALEPRALYRKRVYPESVSWSYGRTYQERLEYFDGYLAVIDQVGLPAWERAALRAAVRLRQGRTLAVREVRRVVAALSASPAGRRPV